MERNRIITTAEIKSTLKEAINTNVECHFQDGIVEEKLTFNNIGNSKDRIDTIIFNNVHFKKGILFNGNITIGFILFQGDCKIDQSLIFDGNLIDTFAIEDGNYDKINYFNGKIKHFNISDVTIKEVSLTTYRDGIIDWVNIGVGNIVPVSIKTLKMGGRNIGGFNLNGVECNTLELQGEFNGKLNTLRDVTTRCLHFVNFSKTRNANFGFYNFQVEQKNNKTEFLIHNSFLSGVRFFNSNFRATENIFFDSDISNIETSNTCWPYKFDAYDYFFGSKDDNSPFIEKEAYKQLKIAFMRNGDRVEELEYYVKEMEVYGNSLEKHDSFDKRLVFAFSHWTNRNGLSWLRPLGIIAASSIVIYFLLLLSTKNCADNLLNFNCNCYLKDFFMVFNPTHNAADYSIVESDRWGVFYFFDFIGRIWMSIMLVQTVTGFRRYFRK